jgi:hypothetical protein
MIYDSHFKVNKIDAGTFENFKKSGVILFGTGGLGALALHALNQKNIKVICFVDNNFSNWDKKFKNYNVISPNKLKSEFNDYPVLISSIKFKYLKKLLKNLQIKNVYDADFLFSNFNLENAETSWSLNRCKVELDLYLYAITSFREKNKLKVNSLDLVLTEKCSLKCKDCSNLMQYYAKPIDEDFSQLITTLDKFMNAVDYVYEIRLIGGEPFMYKRIDEVIKKTLNYKNCGNIVIYTNGTIVPKENKINVFKNDRIYFKISNYGSISRNVQRLEKKLEENNIHYLTERITRWQDCARIEKFDRPIEITKKIFGDCCVNETLTVLHGKLFLCPFSAHAENLHAIPKYPTDSIDISQFQDSEILKDKIRKFYFEKEYLETCKSCNGRDHNVASIDAAIQTKNPIQYKRVF